MKKNMILVLIICCLVGFIMGIFVCNINNHVITTEESLELLCKYNDGKLLDYSSIQFGDSDDEITYLCSYRKSNGELGLCGGEVNNIYEFAKYVYNNMNIIEKICFVL